MAGPGRPPPEPLLISSGRPLGEVHHLDPYWGRDQIEDALADVDRLWVVHATDPDGGDRELDAFLAWDLVVDRFEVVSLDRWPGDIQVLLLVRG